MSKVTVLEVTEVGTPWIGMFWAFPIKDRLEDHCTLERIILSDWNMLPVVKFKPPFIFKAIILLYSNC